MFNQINRLVIFILCAGNLLAVLSGRHGKESSKCSYPGQFVKMERGHIPREGTDDNEVDHGNISARFSVGVTTDNIITGSIKWDFKGDKNDTFLIIRLSSVWDHRGENAETADYFLIRLDSGDNEYNGRSRADLDCIQIPPSANTTITAEVFQINLTSCPCDMANNGCLNLCYMFPVSSHFFQASRVACHYYRKQHYNDHVYVGFEAQMVSSTDTRFTGYFQNVNPFATTLVSIFPDDYDHVPHIAIVSLPVIVNEDGEIHFSIISQSVGQQHDFYAKLKVSCSSEELPDEYLSNTATTKPYKGDFYNLHTSPNIDSEAHSGLEYVTTGEEWLSSGDDQDTSKTQIVYGTVIGLLVVCCIMTIVVWLRIFRRNRNRLYSQNLQNNKNMSRKEETCQNNRVSRKETSAVILYHPDTKSHSLHVHNFIECLRKYGINVHDKSEEDFQNWRDFAEKIGDDFNTVIIILSSGFIELCEIYREKGNNVYRNEKESVSLSSKRLGDERWNKLLEQRHGEYIPCVALDKIRSIIQDKQFDIDIHVVTFYDTDVDGQTDQINDHTKDGHDYVRRIQIIPDSNYETDSSLHSVIKLDPCVDVRKTRNFTDNEENRALLNHVSKNSDVWREYYSSSIESKTDDMLHNPYGRLDFFRHRIFLQTENTCFHNISKNTIERLLHSEESTGQIPNTVQTFSLNYILNNLR